jgi:hypothetical protein
MEYVVNVVSSHIVQPMFDQLLKVGQVPVIWRWVSHHQVQNIMDMSTGHVQCTSCMLLITLKVHFDCGSDVTINFEA